MDAQQQQAANLFTGLGVGAILFAFLFGIAIAAFFVYLFWRVFTKAGLPGPLGLIVLFPGLGPLIAILILAFSDWKVIPAAPGYASNLPMYPPAGYPPSYPPAGAPPPQL